MIAVKPVGPEQAFVNLAGIAADLDLENKRLQAERDEAVGLLRDLVSHYTNRPHCGHDFTCTCKDADVAKVRAFLGRVNG